MTQQPRLQVYVSRHCFNCREALRLADAVAARYPGLVQVIDLDFTPAPLPERVVAVPTYLLDGQVLSFGNPDPEDLFARLREAVA
jgi:hypothetical protein